MINTIRSHALRELSWYTDDDGMWVLNGRLSAGRMRWSGSRNHILQVKAVLGPLVKFSGFPIIKQFR